MSSPTLRSALIGGALITIAVGVFVYLSIDETMGIALAAIGLVDLLTIPFVLGLMARNRTSSGRRTRGAGGRARPRLQPVRARGLSPA